MVATVPLRATFSTNPSSGFSIHSVVADGLATQAVRTSGGQESHCSVMQTDSSGCVPCTGAIRSDADTIEKVIAEVATAQHSERQGRAIDHDQDASMELKKREGYF